MPKRKTVVFSYQLLSNIGCEIIIRGTIAFLSRAFPKQKLHFVVSSYDVNRDRQILSDLPNVEIVPMLGWKRLARGFLKKSSLHAHFWTPRFASRHFRNADLFVSVGGDIYTMFGDCVPEDWLGYERYATAHGIPAMMFGANMERFDVLAKPDLDRLLAHLARFRVIAVRDVGTRDYLAAYGVDNNVDVFPDPIFSLRPVTEFRAGLIRRIGVNVSPFLARTFGPKIITKWAEIVTRLYTKGYEVKLIPHVYASNGDPNIDDLAAIRHLAAALPDPVREAVTVYDGPVSLSHITQVLSDIDMFIGARMHGCLNSLTLGKAVYFIGYSKKAATMVDWLKTESPFSTVAQSFETGMADEVELDDILALIAAHEAWSLNRSGPERIETRSHFDAATVWAHMTQKIDLRP